MGNVPPTAEPIKIKPLDEEGVPPQQPAPANAAAPSASTSASASTPTPTSTPAGADHSTKRSSPRYTAPGLGKDTVPIYPKHGVPWVVEPSAEVTVRLAQRGIAARSPVTILHQFQNAVAALGDVEALKVEKNNQWKTWTWRQYYEDVKCAARAFIRLGIQPFESVNILGFNAPEWHIANCGAIAAGAKAAGIYTTNNPESCRYITEHSDASFVVVENEKQLAKYMKFKLPKVKAIIVYTDCQFPKTTESGVAVMGWEEFMSKGRLNEEKDNDLQQELNVRINNQRPGHCSTLIYTSGTTGNPKAVMLSHDNITWTASAIYLRLPVTGPQRLVSYLPLSHIAAQMLDIHIPLACAANNRVPFTIFFARPDAMKGSLTATLKFAKPTCFFGVPRVWEKMEEKLREVAGQAEGIKKSVFEWAQNIGLEAANNMQVGGNGATPFFYDTADSLIYSTIRDKLGFEQCKYMYTGAAPTNPETVHYFDSIGINVYDMFGMSECTGPHTFSFGRYRKIGSSGCCLPGLEVRIDHEPSRDRAGEGELCLRGRNVMMGYLKDADKTREAVDPDGFLHTGDVAKIDQYGMVYITGRIKELLITAGGENIAPLPVEDGIKHELPAISNAMMVGDRRKYNTVVLTLRTQTDEAGNFTSVLSGPAKTVSQNSKTVEEAIKDPLWTAYIKAGIDRVNKRATSNAQTVQKHVIAPVDFSIPGGELTPTMKLKRAAVALKYTELIESMYQDDKTAS